MEHTNHVVVFFNLLDQFFDFGNLFVAQSFGIVRNAFEIRFDDFVAILFKIML
ncbi:hypothetical protein D3C86_1918240 [compost metagenome]